jgi:hypothetical protein
MDVNVKSDEEELLWAWPASPGRSFLSIPWWCRWCADSPNSSLGSFGWRRLSASRTFEDTFYKFMKIFIKIKEAFLEKNSTRETVASIDWRCADGRFLMLPRGMAVSNTRYLFSSETRVNASIRGWKWHRSESTWCQESVGGICFTNKWRAASLQSLTFSNHC